MRVERQAVSSSTTLGRSASDPGVIRLVLIDDHELVRHGIRALLESQADLVVVGEAATAAEGVRRIGFDQPDVALLDLDLPDGSGVEVCRRIRSVSPATKVLILTAFADPEALTAARNAGASGFILKRVGDSDLIEQIRRVKSGEGAFSDTPVGPAQSSRDPLLKRLTPRETKILELIAEGKTNREIADELFLAEKTVKNYVSNLLLKMGIRHRAGAAAYLARIRAETEFHYPPSVWQRSRLR
jgi:DNA-binding NarL/FixJ family response regulator